jgi:hypothetical protein
LASLLAMVASACGSSADGGQGEVKTVQGEGQLAAPPFPLTDGALLRGVGERLFVTSASKAAVFDFSTSTWTVLPDLPIFATGVTSIDDMVIVMGPDCGAACTEDAVAPIVGAAFDLAEGSDWTSKQLDVEPVPVRFAFPMDVGPTKQGRVIVIRRPIVIDAELAAADVVSPVPRPFVTCANDRGFDQLVPINPVPALASGPPLATIGEGGNAVISHSSGVGDPWTSVAGSETSAIPGPDMSANPGDESQVSVLSSACLAQGMLIASRTQTMQWDGERWTVFPGGPKLEVVPQAVATTTTSGTVVATTSAGALNVFSDGSWRTVEVPGQVTGSLSSATTIGDRVVVFSAEAGKPGRLQEVAV